MKAHMLSDDFNRLIAATKAFTAKESAKTNKELYKYIKLEFNQALGMATAIAVDGYRISVEHSDQYVVMDESFECYIKPIFKSFPSNQDVDITLYETETEIRCCGMAYSCELPAESEFLNYDNVLPQGKPVMEYLVDADFLIAALKAAKASGSSSAKLSFYGEEAPVVIKTNKGRDFKLVLPIRKRAGSEDEK